MSKQFELHALQQHKKACRLSRADIQEHKKKGNMIGYFGLVKLGRPPKQASTKANTDAKGSKTQHESTQTEGSKTQHESTQTNVPKMDWSTLSNFPKLKAAAGAYIAGDHNQETLLSSNVTVPQRTVKRAVAKMKKIIEDGIEFEQITREMMYPPIKHTTKLLEEKDLKFLQEIIVARDDANNGMGRKEVITLIGDLVQCPDRIRCKNHWDYLVRHGTMKELKAGGRVKKAQTTTTKRTQITVEQQLRWHTTIESGIEELLRLNQPREQFEPIMDHFISNLDESCLMSSNGKIHVVASRAKMKTEKITDDCRESITTVRTGFTSGHQGAYFFLAKGKKLDRKKFKNLCLFFKAPEGSEVIMTPNAFMTDEAWLELVPKLCQSIRKQEVIRDHPDWWVLLSLDGFGSHVNVLRTHEIFSRNKMLVIKEEGDTSQVNQAYDQQVAKDDKTHMRAAVDALSPALGMKMDQWYLIVIAIHAQNRIKKESWIDSFKKVNMHPHTRVPFNEWIKKLDERGFLSAEKFFEKRTTLYDAMPACWKRLTIELRQSVMVTIREIYRSAPADEKVWTKQNVLRLAKFVKLDDVFKLRGCFLTANIDPSVIVRVEEESTSTTEEQTRNTAPIDDFCSWKPKHLLTKYKGDTEDKKVQK